MVSKEDIRSVLEKMILSVSGWRGIFAASGDGESVMEEITPVHRIISGAAAFVFAEYLLNTRQKPLILAGSDTRPTSPAISKAMIPVLLASGCGVRYAGAIAAPEIMAWARGSAVAGGPAGFAEGPAGFAGTPAGFAGGPAGFAGGPAGFAGGPASFAGGPASFAGFVYISASHNPIGHNGLKFGLTDGGVLPAGEMAKLTSNFRLFLDRDDCAAAIENLIRSADPALLRETLEGVTEAKAESAKAYFGFCNKVVWNGSAEIAAAVKEGLAQRPLGIVCDFNGAARTVSIDRDYLTALGLQFESINSKPGEIAHRIVPEGESLDPCREALESAHKRDQSFVLGYMPDCDGDRGNVVIWDDGLGKARILEAQEVFALACVAELSHMAWAGELSYDSKGKALIKAAIAVNDPTSMRIDRIASAFGVSVFRAEVGEANVVGLARRLREEGYIVRILGEGSAGGNITHPSAVRDPINTLLAMVKLLSVRGSGEKPGLFKIWLKLSGKAETYRDDFGMTDIIASLPPFASTPAYSEDAVLRVNTKDHGILKDRYQEVFAREWEERKDSLKAKYGIQSWDAFAYNGMEERQCGRFGEAGNGGLKIRFLNGEGAVCAAIWMRGSATEPLFRVMADAEGSDKRFERDLIEWQRRMTIESDRRSQ
ncbi:MAG: phosphatidylglycerol lysyltransferase [Treponema sp.]|jgi:phosphoglucomutase|nr:phosphatidylglycerol lysyltransferase [Treponema sp.]